MTPLAALPLALLPFLQDPQAKALPRVGDRAPALEFDDVSGLPEGKTALELTGKVVVLEFSTSWCAGCRASVPHWNELAQQFAGEPIAFVSVTNEDQATAQRFARETGLRTPIATDLDGSLFEAFAVGGIPDVVVIGKDGRITGFTHPTRLEAKELRQLLAGEPVTFPAGIARANRSWNHAASLKSDIEPGTLVVRPCAKPSGIVQTDQKTGAISAGGVPLPALWQLVLDCGPGDVELDPALATDTLYELRTRGTDGTAAGTRAFARERLQAELGISVTTGMVAGKVLVLRRSDGHAGPPPADASRQGGSLRAGELQFGSITAARLAAALKALVSRPVLDQTGLTQPFSLDLKWDAGKGADGLRGALAEAGLVLEEVERPLPHYRLVPKG